MIFIFTGPIQSGKTTSLINWSGNRNDVCGILTPVVSGKRVFMNAQTKEQFPMEVTEREEEVLAIGKFIFSKTGFDRAAQIIREAMHKKGWLIIDEIGPLELRDEGFHAIVKAVAEKRKEKIILVVREGLAKQVGNHFNINAEIITSVDNL